MLSTIATVSSEFHRDVVDSGRLAAFLFFVALLGTFGFIRTSTHMIRAQVKWWPGNVSVGGTHVHHLVWGIFAIMIFGYVGVVIQPDSPWREIVTVLFAIGIGLTLDEFALWLELKDVYWEKEGRKSVDAMIVAACLSGMAVVGFSAWIGLADDVATGVFALVGGFGVLAIATTIVNAAKQKFGMALLGLVFWPVAVVSALRLARPHSLWARLLYRDAKRRLSAERYGGDAPTATVAPRSPAEGSSGAG